MPSDKSPAPADRKLTLARNVIRYWMAILAYQEALAARPKARRPAEASGGGGAIRLDEPVPGQEYAKLTFAGAESFLVDRRGDLALPITAEWAAFFEHWLAGRYRRGEDAEDGAEQLVFFPTLHLARDELAGLLRFPIDVQWRSEQGVFEVPDYAQRRRGTWPAPPTQVQCKQSSAEPDDALPFFVDAKTLRDTLRVDSEHIDDFFAQVRTPAHRGARQLVAALCALIEQQNALDDPRADDRAMSTSAMCRPAPSAHAPSAHAPSAHAPSAHATDTAPPETPRALLARLVAAVSRRLALVQSRARVYPVALVVCSDQSRATWHLQKDLNVVLEDLAHAGLSRDSPLYAYLTGAAPKRGERLCWGRWRGAGLTDSQRAAGELALGSKLAAVQGPPGTGKTTLILNMLAHTLIRKVTALARGGAMGRAIAVVTSTNNRAVDNVVDPLGRDLDPMKLPLSLRVGSRQVLEHVTRADLGRVRGWLEEEMIPDLQARPALQAELERFRRLQQALDERLTGDQHYRQRLERLRAVETEMDEVRAECAPGAADREAQLCHLLAALTPREGAPTGASLTLATADDAPQALTKAHPDAIRAFVVEIARHASAAVELRQLADRLEALGAIAAGHGREALALAKRHWKQTEKKQLTKVRQALGFPVFDGRLPPAPEPASVEDALEAWEEAAEAMGSAVRELTEVLLGKHQYDQAQVRLATLEKELATLRAATAAPPPPIEASERADLDAQHLELFECAVRVREAWASVHRADLLGALDRACRAIESTRSLRSLMDKQSDAVRWLRELFPAWGCTLLSLGNVFPCAPESLSTVVIDEAGQCHPAYAVSALVRAESALVIGDVHQLEPVVGLGVDDERRILQGLSLEIGVDKLAPFRAYDGSATSAQSVADRAVVERPTLVDHFRCQPEIAAICEALCRYGLVTKTPPRTRADVAPLLTAPVLHLDVDGTQERFAGSWVNEAEIRATLMIVRELLECGIFPEEIGVVTPYRGQLERLWRALREARVPLARTSVEADFLDGDAFERTTGASDRGLVVGTVHRFQGGERSIILLTTTVTQRRSLEFVDGRVNLINVAASRARDHLITIGHSPTLRAGRHTRYLVDHAQPFGQAISARSPA